MTILMIIVTMTVKMIIGITVMTVKTVNCVNYRYRLLVLAIGLMVAIPHHH